MKKIKIVIGFIFTLCFISLEGQRSIASEIWLNPNTTDFKTIQEEAEEWFRNKDKGRGSGYKQWKRWEEYNKFALDQNGNITNHAALRSNAFGKVKKLQKSQSDTRSTEGLWKPWSSSTYTNVGSWSPGIGRINTIAYHPTDVNTLYVGTPAGGLFRTVNNGDTWTCLTDDIASIGVSGIAIHPTSPNIMYILTGDGDGGDTRSVGVFKSTDGGNNWNATGLAWGLFDIVRGYKIVMEPGNPNNLLVAADNGIWRSTNAGSTWGKVSPNDGFIIIPFTDLEYNPGDSQEVYASTTDALYKSNNGGATWGNIWNIPDASRIQISVNSLNPDNVYLIAGPNTGTGSFRGVLKSSNKGASFTSQTTTPNILGGALAGDNNLDQATYDLAITSSPVNDSVIITGGVNIWRSLDDGNNFNIIGYWNLTDNSNTDSIPYVHADIHHLSFNPLNNRLYAGTDGGIFFSDDEGTSWTDITSGLQISQIYHIDGTDDDTDLILGGLQDNGTAIFRPSSMDVLLGADGGDCIIDPNNIDRMFAMTQFGNIRRSTNGGQNFTIIDPATTNGPFITRMAMDPNNSNNLIIGWTNGTIFRTTNAGNTYTQVSLSSDDSNDVNFISYATSSIIFACTRDRVFRSTNAGVSWSEIVDDPLIRNITCVIPVPDDDMSCYFSRGAFDNEVKVWKYNNGTDLNTPVNFLTEPLPNVPVRTLAIADNASNILYAGTDIGVYTFDENNLLTGWKMFNRNLPNVPVYDIEIYEQLGIMRIATHGRGIWESDLFNDCSYTINLTVANDPDNSNPGFQFYEAAERITSTRQILGSSGDVTYKAYDSVLLKPGFKVTSGNMLRLGIKACGVSLD